MTYNVEMASDGLDIRIILRILARQLKGCSVDITNENDIYAV
jgi:hypothetical protein